MMRMRPAFTPLFILIFAAISLSATATPPQSASYEDSASVTQVQQQSSAQAQSSASQSGASQTGVTQNPAAAQTASAANAGAASAAIPSYPDSPKGLEDLMKKMLELKKKGDDKALAPYIESLKLPDPDTFFRSTFGDQIGRQIENSYASLEKNLAASFTETVAELNSKHLGHPQAVLFTSSCDTNATDSEYQVLFSRIKEQPLYDVRFRSESQNGVVSYFAYVDGAFRYIGNIRLHLPESPIVDMSPKDMISKCVNRVVPTYPVEAKTGRIQGSVLLHAIIGPEGNVCSLHVIRGDPLLAKAAYSAVRQWRYARTIVGGKPVAVNTTITVIFNLE